MTAHPDKGGTEAKMAAVNEAYEVLSKPGSSPFLSIPTESSFALYFAELKARFDAGEDPNDPTAGQGGFPGGHPFANFFHQGSGGFQFQHGFNNHRGR